MKKTNREIFVGGIVLSIWFIVYWMTLISPFIIVPDVRKTALILIPLYTLLNIITWFHFMKDNSKKEFLLKVILGFTACEAMLVIPYIIILLIKGII